MAAYRHVIASAARPRALRARKRPWGKQSRLNVRNKTSPLDCFVAALLAMTDNREGLLASREQPLGFQIVVEMGDEFAVAVPDQGRLALVDAEHALGGLAPARM